MSIVTADNFAVLGIGGIDSLLNSFGNELNSVQSIDESFIEKVKSMKTHSFGFTEEYKVKFLGLFESKIGKHCLLCKEWLMGYESERAKELMNYVRSLDNT